MYIVPKQKGFTLVEMLVSLAIFTVVALIAVGALLKITDANKKAQTLKVTTNNVNYAMESMSREIRMGTNYYCDFVEPSDISSFILSFSEQSCPGGSSLSNDWYLAFKSSKTCTVGNVTKNLVYSYSSVTDSTNKAILYKRQQIKNGDNCVPDLPKASPILSPEFVVTNSQLKVLTNDVGFTTPRQPYAWFHITGYTGEKDKVKSTFDIQSGAVQRNVDAVASQFAPPPPPPPPCPTCSITNYSGSISGPYDNPTSLVITFTKTGFTEDVCVVILPSNNNLGCIGDPFNTITLPIPPGNFTTSGGHLTTITIKGYTITPATSLMLRANVSNIWVVTNPFTVPFP